LVLVLGIAGIVFALRQGGDDSSGPESTAKDYLADWSDGDTAAMEKLVDAPPIHFADTHQAVIDALQVTTANYELGEVNTNDDVAIAKFDATLTLNGLGDWSYQGSMQLDRTSDSDQPWKVQWSPTTVHPKLTETTTLARTRAFAPRAPITDLNGQPLVTDGPAVIVGIEPRRMQDRQQVKDALSTQLGVDPASVDAKVDAPGVEPDHFVPIVTVAEPRYEQVRSVIYPVPGLVFRDTTQRMGPTEGFARHVLGRTGEITAEVLTELGPPYAVGDVVGLTGLEAKFQQQLAGTPSGDINLVDAQGNVVEAIGRVEGTAPVPVATTLDPTVQAAVEAGLDGVDKPAAVVVVDGQGNIRGVASRPLDDGFNRAIGGSYPPGSTFKVVTTSALLDAGTTPDTPVDCPETVNAGGRVFKNFESHSLGQVPFGLAFAESCNTAFINATMDTPAADLLSAAQRLGFNTDYSVGLTTVGGSYPEPGDATDKAASVIGQGRVLASPLHMATVAGAVMDGTWESPTLLPDLPAEDRPAPTSLPQATRDTLSDLMRRVVTEGSGTAANVPGPEVHGKTGTAEFGEGNPLPTHAWFIAFRGDLAMAIVIEGGGVGGRDAAPVAAQILAALPS
jgi:cell division protein FtsI/penicillin-binding protein 2